MANGNILTDVGRNLTTGKIKGVGSGIGFLEPKYIGIGTGTTTPAAADTALVTEDWTSLDDGSSHKIRVTGTSSQATVTVTNDTYQVVGTITAAHSTAVTEAGLFDTVGTSANLTTAPSGGNMYMRTVFSVINLATSDTLQLTLGNTYA